MVDTPTCITEVAVLLACLLWSCSLAFVRNKLARPLKSGATAQVILLRLAALGALVYAVQTSWVWSIVASMALCIMLVSLNSIVLALLVNLLPAQKKRH